VDQDGQVLDILLRLTDRASINRTELTAPVTTIFVADGHPTLRQHFLDGAVAEGETIVEPDRVTDDFRWKTVAFIRGSR